VTFVMPKTAKHVRTLHQRLVTVRLSLNFILGVKIYTLDTEDRVS
jgi:hypothetical protein